MNSIPSVTSPWYSIKGDPQVNALGKIFMDELKLVKENTLKNLEVMESDCVKKYQSLVGLSYAEKIKQFDFNRLEKIQNKIKELKTANFNSIEIAQFCFENNGLITDEGIKNEALHYFNLYHSELK
jgi:hypothetical protein